MNFDQLSPSERRLVAAFALMLLVVVNFFGVRFFMNRRAQIVDAAAQTRSEIASLEELEGDAGMWERRMEWLRKSQPRLESEAAAGSALLNAVKESASRHGLTVSKHQPASAKPEAGAVAIPLQFELRGSWKGFCEFLMELQGPERFVVVQNARLKVDPSDATVMHGDFTIAKWFAPR